LKEESHNRATGSEWDHQKLYLTKNGAPVLYSWSQRQGVGESYRLISRREAVHWLIANDHELPKSLADAAEESEV